MDQATNCILPQALKSLPRYDSDFTHAFPESPQEAEADPSGWIPISNTVSVIDLPQKQRFQDPDLTVSIRTEFSKSLITQLRTHTQDSIVSSEVIQQAPSSLALPKSDDSVIPGNWGRM